MSRYKTLAQLGLTVSEAIARGAEQLSRKYHLIAILGQPPSAEALREEYPEDYLDLRVRFDQECANLYARKKAQDTQNQIELTPEEWNEYLTATGRSPGRAPE